MILQIIAKAAVRRLHILQFLLQCCLRACRPDHIVKSFLLNPVLHHLRKKGFNLRNISLFVDILPKVG